jgi:hypothetical protein
MPTCSALAAQLCSVGTATSAPDCQLELLLLLLLLLLPSATANNCFYCTASFSNNCCRYRC